MQSDWCNLIPYSWKTEKKVTCWKPLFKDVPRKGGAGRESTQAYEMNIQEFAKKNPAHVFVIWYFMEKYCLHFISSIVSF